MASELSLFEKISDEFTEVKVNGEVDIYTSKEFKERLYDLLESNRTDMKIDCEELKYIDSTGLGILVGSLKKARLNGNNIYITGLKENIKKLFLITGLDKLFFIEE